MPDLATPSQIGCLTGLAALLIAAAWQDLRTLHIGNGLAIAIVALFAVWAAIGLVGGTCTLGGIGLSIACATGLFAVGVAAFAAGVMGGGDVKLLAATGLFAGPAQIVDLLLVTALAGGLLGIAVLAGAPIGPVSGAGAAVLRRRLPYGPAIAAGGLWVATRLAVG
ncbi:MAG: pilus assembly protein CpaA [Reyranella sp.]|uniref:A24 family peptidase n=1 Tax=Reyranella sp. TaxID=1929291 RepID=UPI0012090D67|nr:prepilin peptidase [Reyranella sp.]TAJ90594.1 MAG: pilus assembly protein CpaA [Reyranella sp.]